MTPDGWRSTTLGDVASIRRGASPRPIQDRRWFAEDGPGWVRIADVTRSSRVLSHTEQRLSPEGVARSVRVGPGDVLLSIAATVGKPIVVGMDACIHDGFVAFSQLRLDATFLYYLLGAKASELAGLGQTGTQKNINSAIVSSAPILLPPLSEQRKIAVILSSADDAIEATQAVSNQLGVVKKAMMADLLTRGVPGRHARFRTTTFGDIPETWRTARIGDVTEPVRTPVEVVPTSIYREIGVRSHCKGVFHKEPVSGKALGSKRVFYVEPECIVVNIVFAWEGAVASTSASEVGMIASHRFPLLRPKSGLMNLQYLRLLLQTRRGVELLGSISPGGAGRNKTLDQGALLRLEVPVPPLPEQELVAGAITSVELAIASERARLQGLLQARAGLMSVLLTGEVRVKPDEEAA